METAAKSQALDDALAQIDHAFGKDTAARHDYVKVWTDRYTEDLVRRFIRERVDSYMRADDGEEGTLPYDGEMWDAIFDDIDCGEHRVIPHPKNRRWPPFTPWEDMRLAVRRVLGWFQRGED